MTPDRRRISGLWIVWIAAGHFLVERAIFFATFRRGMRRFDTGEPSTPIDGAADALVFALNLPIVSWTADRLPAGLFDGLAGYLLFVANSLVWGLVLWGLLVGFQRARAAAPG